MSNAYDLVTIFNKLIGNITAYGEHNSDMDKYETLDDVDKLLEYISTQLIINAKNKDSVAESIRLVGEKSYDLLVSLYDYITDSGLIE